MSHCQQRSLAISAKPTIHLFSQIILRPSWHFNNPQLKPFGHMECSRMKTSENTSGPRPIVILQQMGSVNVCWEGSHYTVIHPTLASTFQCPRSSHQATWDYSVERFPRHICTTNGRALQQMGNPKEPL